MSDVITTKDYVLLTSVGLSQSRLKEVLNYDPVTGEFIWNVSLSNRQRAGASAGGVSGSTGYHRITVNGSTYLSHRLAWLYVYGEWPEDQLDHINGNRADNRIANLRQATNSANQQNIAMRSHNSTGFTGVWKRFNKYMAEIRHEGKRYKLGSYDSAEDAYESYLMAKETLHTFQPTPRTVV